MFALGFVDERDLSRWVSQGRPYRQVSEVSTRRLGLESFSYELWQRVHPPNEGRALSFALKLKNKNSGTNQTHIAKNAAMSMKAGALSVTCPLPYRYFGPR